MAERPFWMSGSGREAHPVGRAALPDDWRWSEGSLVSLRVVRRPSRMSGSGWEALSDVWEWSVGPPVCPGVVRRPSRMTGSGQEALSDVREWS